MELYLPPTYAKIKRGCEYYETTETFKRRSAASKEKMRKYWSDEKNRQRVDKKQAKPLDVFTLDGEYVATYPSSRKAAIAMFPDKDYHSAERCIRACRQKDHPKKSYLGYMFRDHVDGVTRIEPYQKKPHGRGYHYERRKEDVATVGVTVRYDDGTELRFESVKECVAAIHGSPYGIWCALKEGRKYKGMTIIKDKERKAKK